MVSLKRTDLQGRKKRRGKEALALHILASTTGRTSNNKSIEKNTGSR
jgi:hypothetical protein